jgi:hypothetical protein
VRDSILQVVGLLVLLVGPLFLLYQAFLALRDIRRIVRKAPQVDAEIVRITAMNASLRLEIGLLKADVVKLDGRIAAWEAWARKVVKPK